MSRESKTGLIIAALVAFVLYLLTKGGLLHESVSAGIITPQGTVIPDPATGYPQFDASNPLTLPANFSSATPPIDSTNGAITTAPRDPKRATCPVGYSLWHDANGGPGGYWCILNSV